MTITDTTFTDEPRYEAFRRSQQDYAEFKGTKADAVGSEERRSWDAEHTEMLEKINAARRRFADVVDVGELAEAIECCFVRQAEVRPEEMLDFSTIQTALSDFIPYEHTLYEFLKTKIRNALNELVRAGRVVEMRVASAPGRRPYGTRDDMKVWQTANFVFALQVRADHAREVNEATRERKAALALQLEALGVEVEKPHNDAINRITLSLESVETLISLIEEFGA